MKTSCFDAALNFPPDNKGKHLDALLLVKGMKIQAFLNFYERVQGKKAAIFFARVYLARSLLLKWKDKFKVQELRKARFLGEGYVLNPFSEKVSRKKSKKKVDFLMQLQGEEKEMLRALVQEKGISGLKEKEVLDFSYLNKKSLLYLIQELETEGIIRILSFAPLFLLSQESLDFLCQKILTFIAHFHEKHPGQTGVPLEKVKRRFSVHSRILSLAMKHLAREGQIREYEKELALFDFETRITPEEENILKELEDMCFKGEFQSVSLEDIQKRFHLSSKNLHRLLSFLVERRKIVRGKDGFLLHSRWLNEIIGRIRKSGKKELTVTDFKKMTGLTRKYAIPLLELLDQMGVTQRKGSSRVII